MVVTAAVTIHSRACQTFRTASKLRTMPIFGSRRSASPRLVPELDDTKLGRVRKQLQGPAVPGLMDIRIDVECTPECTFGRADLFEDAQFRGRLSIGSPRATPEDVANRLSDLARAKVDIWRSVQSHRRPAH